jgi:DNA repair protein RecO
MSEVIKTTAICTRVTDYRENDKLVELCSLELGKILVNARGCKKPSAKLKFAASPFCFGNYMLAKTGDRYTLCDCEEIDSFSALTADLDSFYAGFAVLELLSKTQEGGANADAVLAAVRALKAVCYDGALPYSALNSFIIETMSALGFSLDFSVCSVCGEQISDDAAFTEADGVTCASCAGYNGIKLSKDLLNCLREPIVCRDGANASRANILLRDIVYLVLGIKLNTLKHGG